MSTNATEIWTKSKLLIKAGIIFILVLLLLIPTYSVKELIAEREARQKEAIAEVSQKWAGKQSITGPLLVIPYWQTITDTVNKTRVVKHTAFILPTDLAIQSVVVPQEKHRGIYKVMLYTTHLYITGNFNNISIESLKIPAENVVWKEAYLQLGITDTKGLDEELKMSWNDTTLTFAPGASATGGRNGLTAPLAIHGIEDLKNTTFSTNIHLSGSEQLLFNPIGKTTTVTVKSNWPHPSFTGTLLPQSTSVKDSGFTATWKSLAYKRDFPQQFKEEDISGNSYNLSSAAFGVDLFVPVNGYQKTMRSIKYAILCIALTFTAFFLIEMINKVFVHPFQYGLIGLALVLFYTLLLSFSEYTGFNIAYAIASVCTIGLIGWFVSGIVSSNRLSLLLSMVLLLLYSYVFTILQLQDYALLVGSIGLFLTLAVVMYFSRKIQW